MPCIRRTPKEREENEMRIQNALNALRSGKYANPARAAREHGVNPRTLRDRWLERRRDNKTAHLSQQLLSNAQRKALASWCVHLSQLDQPLDRVTVSKYVHALCGKYPSGSWVYLFLREYRNSPVPNQTFPVHRELSAGYPTTSTDEVGHRGDADEEIGPVSTRSIEVTQSSSVVAPAKDPTPSPKPQLLAYHGASTKIDVTLKDILPPPGTILNTKSQLAVEIVRLRSCLERAIAQTESALTHTALMVKQNADLQRKINAIERSGGKKRIKS
ncbi:hypothetical protein FRC11_007072 [Ceratobasidium sp. 423]|nr:hypothetical protein FRC11_007072 [Ceratobasidium sp. 423]